MILYMQDNNKKIGKGKKKDEGRKAIKRIKKRKQNN